MFDFALFGILLVALAFGWSLGKYGPPRIFLGRKASSEDYLKGLTYLINEQSDVAVEGFIDQLEVTPQTLEMHLSIGGILRRKGEFDRAVRIHQNLIDSRSLGEREINIAQLELARDFYSAGILDRAETILLDLIDRSLLLRADSQQLLLVVYQDERSWLKAINIASQLRKQYALEKDARSSLQQLKVTKALAHFSCEIAEEKLTDGALIDAQTWVDKAINYDMNCVRANLLEAKLAILNHNESKAKKSLLAVAKQDSSLFSEAAEQLATLSFDDDTLKNVAAIQKLTPSFSGFMYVVAANQQLYGISQAEQFVRQELASHPSLIGLSTYLQLRPNSFEDDTGSVFKTVLQGLLQRRSRYYCLHCGFRGIQMHWLCPSCKQWGEIRQRYGL